MVIPQTPPADAELRQVELEPTVQLMKDVPADERVVQDEELQKRRLPP